MDRMTLSAVGEILMHGLSRGVIVLDPDCRVIRWNRWMEKHSGVAERDILGQSLLDRYPEIRERGKDRYLTKCVEERRASLLSPLLHHHFLPLDIVKDKASIEMFQEVKIFPFGDKHDTSGAVIVISDMTEQFLHEKEILGLAGVLRGIRDINQLITQVENEDELFPEACRILREDIGYLFSWIGLAEHGSHAIRPVACEGGGIGIGEFRGMWGENRSEMVECAIRTGKTQIFSLKDTGEFPFGHCHIFSDHMNCKSSCCLPLRIGDRVVGVMGICSHEDNIFKGEELDLLEEVASDIAFAVKTLRDRKKQRELERQLRHSQKMEAVGTLAGGIAHDFNNILGIIVGYTEAIKMFDLSKASPLHPKLNSILEACYRAKELVRQILTFCRKTDETKAPVEITLIVKEAAKFLRSSLPSNMEIRQHIGGNLPPVLANPTHIHQVIMNLCTNAAHAMRKKGGILEIEMDLRKWEDIRNSESDIANLKPEDHIRLAVRDTGCGMTSEIRERIFDPYFTTKEQGEGTGLGLSTVIGIVKSHGGAVNVRSEPEKGSMFEVLLPVLKKETVQEKIASSEPLPRGNESILLVDDEDGILASGKAILNYLGYEVVTETSSVKALEIFHARPSRFDLVITDLTMPKMAGDELARKLMCVRPGIPVILCTGYSEKISESEARDMGIRHLAIKPVGVRTFAEIARKALDE